MENVEENLTRQSEMLHELFQRHFLQFIMVTAIYLFKPSGEL